MAWSRSRNHSSRSERSGRRYGRGRSTRRSGARGYSERQIALMVLCAVVLVVFIAYLTHQ